jgi:hypothetical protein
MENLAARLCYYEDALSNIQRIDFLHGRHILQKSKFLAISLLAF